LGLKDNKENFVFNASRDWKPMDMFLYVGRYMGVTGKSGNIFINRIRDNDNIRAP